MWHRYRSHSETRVPRLHSAPQSASIFAAFPLLKDRILCPIALAMEIAPSWPAKLAVKSTGRGRLSRWGADIARRASAMSPNCCWSEP